MKRKVYLDTNIISYIVAKPSNDVIVLSRQRIKAFRDALHLAIASVHEIDFVVTWNFSHLANGETIRRLWETNLALGIYVPAIVSPEELGEGK
jgi:hypothetical protein